MKMGRSRKRRKRKRRRRRRRRSVMRRGQASAADREGARLPRIDDWRALVMRVKIMAKLMPAHGSHYNAQ